MRVVREKEKVPYYIGLDVGTESIGWAVTNEQYEIIKRKGKSLWGIRLFDEAATAEDRRVKRVTRRRLTRRTQRTQLLQTLFAEEISKVDQGFFQRMKESRLFAEDKTTHQPFSLFNDIGYTDREYNEQYPTIYHLRAALLQGKVVNDPRLLYIAIHHIIKYRGHFLFEGNVEAATSFDTVYEQFSAVLVDELNAEMPLVQKEDISKILKSKEIKGMQKKKQLMKLLGISNKNKQMVAIISVIAGLTGKLVDLFNDKELEVLEKKGLSFADNSYEEVYNELEGIYPEKCYAVEVLRSLYDWSLLAEILRDDTRVDGVAEYLAYAKVNQYSKHSQDLKYLKEVCRYLDSKTYKEVFVAVDVKDNYCMYVGSCKVQGKKHAVKRCKKEDFYKTIKSLLKKLEKVETTEEIEQKVVYIQKQMEQDTFLPLQISKSNGVIPHQLHLNELDRILEQAEKQYIFLQEKDEKGLSISQKIRSIFLFRIPYYVGPLNDAHREHGANCWLVKRSNEPIRPWNFDEVVDKDASAEKFIERMTNKCTYLMAEDVLPKNSLLYSEYTVLNELANVKIKGEQLSVPTKQLIVEKLFKKDKSVTKNKLYKHLRSEGYELELGDITGIEDKFLNGLASYCDFNKKVFKGKMKEYRHQQIADDVIRYCTLYSNDHKMVTRVLKKQYGEVLTDEHLKAIRGLRYVGWGRLSEKLLRGIEGSHKETGVTFNIIQGLRETNENLMQLLSASYSFVEKIEEENSKLSQEIGEISYEALVKKLPLSPSIKRVTWQTLQIVEEIKQVMGNEPTKIFIEMARGPQEKVRTMSRQDQLIKLYESCKEEGGDWKKELENTPESDFRSIKLYLYYTQKGKCMYTGESIALSELANVNIYDRDHIYPQSKTKDDSIDNLVLVQKQKNAEKDNGILSSEIQHKMTPTWKALREGGFISQEKYNRLIRRTPLTPEELSGFINRQLVETRQSTKAIATLLKQMNKESDIVYVKAKLVSEFRQKELKCIKSRSMNDLHHAKDAYLNIVVGNVYHTKFTSNPLVWLKKNVTPEYSLNQMYTKDIYEGEKCVWKRGSKGSKQVIEAYMKKNNILYTRYAICNKGELFNQQINSPKDNPTVPIKKGLDISKYGGYKVMNPAYFTLVESEDKKGKRQLSIESIPLYLAKQFEANQGLLITYCEQYYGLKAPKIVIPRIKKNTLFKINGFWMHLRGSTGEQLILQGAVQLCMNSDEEQHIKRIEKYLDRNAKRADKKTNLPISLYDGITKEGNLHLYNALIQKHQNTIYNNKPANQVNTLQEKRLVFEELEVEMQSIILGEILKLFQCKSITADLSLLKCGKMVGSMKIGKKIMNTKQCMIVHQSITGLYEKTIDLLKI